MLLLDTSWYVQNAGTQQTVFFFFCMPIPFLWSPALLHLSAGSTPWEMGGGTHLSLGRAVSKKISDPKLRAGATASNCNASYFFTATSVCKMEEIFLASKVTWSLIYVIVPLSKSDFLCFWEASERRLTRRMVCHAKMAANVNVSKQIIY